jgi:hypothetical protein
VLSAQSSLTHHHPILTLYGAYHFANRVFPLQIPPH